jgi:hypothetical protein
MRCHEAFIVSKASFAKDSKKQSKHADFHYNYGCDFDPFSTFHLALYSKPSICLCCACSVDSDKFFICFCIFFKPWSREKETRCKPVRPAKVYQSQPNLPQMRDNNKTRDQTLLDLWHLRQWIRSSLPVR